MPYSLKGKCVMKGNEVVKCHPTHAKALAHFRALKLNVDLKEKATRVFLKVKSQFDKLS